MAKKTKVAKKKKAEKKVGGGMKISDRELRKIQKELRESRGKSILIEQDIKRLKEKLNFGRLQSAGSGSSSRIFHRDFVFRCGKCVGEFKHTAKISVIDHKVVCPKCSEEHLLQITPKAGDYKVKLPKSMKLVR